MTAEKLISTIRYGISQYMKENGAEADQSCFITQLNGKRWGVTFGTIRSNGK